MQIGLVRIHLLATSVLNGSPTLLGATPARKTSFVDSILQTDHIQPR